MARNALLGLGMVAPDDEWRLTRAVNALGFGPMTQATQAGRPNALLSAGVPAARPNDYLAPVAEMISPTLGGYGAGQLIGEGSRAIGQGDYLGGGAGLALGMAGMIPGAPKKGIRAYHGSPHDFDKFSLDKIGTGEGAQAYGHGLYFAESEGVAKSYRDNLSIDRAVGNPDATAANLINKGMAPDAVAAAFGKLQDDFSKRVAASATSGSYKSADMPGRMYEVRINADPEDFLDWDKPLSQQSEKVRAIVGQAVAVDNVDVRQVPGGWQVFVNDKPASVPYGRKQDADARVAGGVRTSNVTNATNNVSDIARDPALVEQLREAGIPGVRYLDQGSRGAGDGSRNYVVFRDDIIDIVKKYGLAAAVSTYGFDAVRGAMEDQQQ